MTCTGEERKRRGGPVGARQSNLDEEFRRKCEAEAAARRELEAQTKLQMEEEMQRQMSEARQRLDGEFTAKYAEEVPGVAAPP